MDLSTRVVKKKFTIDDAWFELRLLSEDEREGKDPEDVFLEVVCNWGEVYLDGKLFECNDKNKKKFFKMVGSTGDLVQKILEYSSSRIFFGINSEVYIARLGELQITSNGMEKHSQNHTSQAVNDV